MQRRFIGNGLRGFDLSQHFTLADAGQARGIVMAIAIEQHAGIPLLQAQHAHQMRRSAFRQCYVAANRQGKFNEATGQAHAVASSMAARVTQASSASCLSSTQ